MKQVNKMNKQGHKYTASGSVYFKKKIKFYETNIAI